MKRNIATQVRSFFQRELGNKVPQFVLQERTKVPKGCVLYMWELHPTITCFMSLQLSTKSDKFTIECAWSKKHRFPWNLLPSFPVDLPEDGVRHEEPQDGEMRFPVSLLWSARGETKWWSIGERAMTMKFESLADVAALVRPQTAPDPDQIRIAVEEAVASLEQYAVPYFIGLLKR